MKKSFVVVLALMFVLGIAGTAFAAANPFVDVPAKHWAYEAVAKLAKAGIVDGYGDGTFRGDKTMTRYEMAQIVAKAMAKSDKADAQLKATIDKLAVEFASELNNLGVRVTTLEKKVGTVKITGQLRERYENTEKWDTTSNEYLTRLRLFMTADLDGNFKFVGRYGQESKAGEATDSVNMDQAYITGKAFGLNEVAVGRMPLYLGKGMIMDSSANWDGAKIGFGNEVKFFAGVAKKNYRAATAAGFRAATAADVAAGATTTGGAAAIVGDPIAVAAVAADNRTFAFANLAYAFNKDFDMTASYFKDNGKKSTGTDNGVANYKTWAVGAAYKGIKNITLSAEYAKNNAEGAKALNNNDAPKAWNAQVKYLGAVAAKPQSWGLWVGYRKAENGFDPKNYTTLASTVDVGTLGGLNDIKGYEYGFEYTVFKNAVFDLRYMPMKNYQDTADKKMVVANVVYNF